MKFSQCIAIALFFAGDVVCAPTPLESWNKGRSFRVERVRRHNNAIYGPTAIRRAYLKYGIVPTDLVIELDDFEPLVKAIDTNSNNDIVEPDQTGAVSAASVFGDAAFVSPITIGGQKLTVTFDTGSSDLWVMNTRLPEEQRQGRTVFDPSKSTTFRNMPNAQFNITYGDDSFAAGEVGFDTVNVGGATVTDQAIGLPLKIADSFIEDTYTDGLVGLGFSSLNTVKPQQQLSFFHNIAGNLDEPVLSVSLVSGGVGEYEFGVIDKAKYKGDMVNVSIDTSSGYWQFESSYFRIGDGDMKENKGSPSTIADTGTSLMLLNQHIVDAYYKQVPGALYAPSASGYIYPCKTALPNFSIAIGPQHLATVPGDLLDFSEVGTNTTTGEPVCYGGIQSNQGIDMQILGDAFLKSFFVVFDLRGPSIGVASPV